MTMNDSTNSGKSTSAAVDDYHWAIAYSLDALIPRLYFWYGAIRIRIGGSSAESTYSGTLHSSIRVALVLPGDRIYSTYRGSYDLR